MSHQDSTLVSPKILLLTDNLKIGGVQNVVVRLANELIERGFHVGVAASAEGDLWGRLPAGCSTHPIPGGKGIVAGAKRLRALRKIIKSNRFKIVHSHQRGITFTAKIALSGLPVVIVEHVHNIFLPVTKRCASFRGRYLIACGSVIETMLKEDYKRHPESIYRILNGVPDLKQTAPVGQSVSKRSNGPINIIAIGRTSEQKNPLKFIDVIESLSTKGCAIQAEWVGDGELLEECRAEIAKRKIPNVVFSGAHAGVAEKLAKSDVLLMTSRWEGLPLVVLEAMSLGIGAILPDVGSCKDAIESGHNGFLYPPDADAGHIADLIAKKMSYDVLQEWGTASRTRYLEFFTLERMVDEVERVYTVAAKDLGTK